MEDINLIHFEFTNVFTPLFPKSRFCSLFATINSGKNVVKKHLPSIKPKSCYCWKNYATHIPPLNVSEKSNQVGYLQKRFWLMSILKTYTINKCRHFFYFLWLLPASHGCHSVMTASTCWNAPVRMRSDTTSISLPSTSSFMRTWITNIIWIRNL